MEKNTIKGLLFIIVGLCLIVGGIMWTYPVFDPKQMTFISAGILIAIIGAITLTEK